MPNFVTPRNAHETRSGRRAAKFRHTFNYEAMKALNDDVQMRSDWDADLHRRRTAGGRQAQGASDAEAGTLYRVIRIDQPRRPDPRPVLRQRHQVPWPAASTGISASSRTPPAALARKRIKVVTPIASADLLATQPKRAKPRCRSDRH